MKQSKNLTKPTDLRLGNIVISLKPKHLDTNNITPNLLDRQQIKSFYGLGSLVFEKFYFKGYPLNLQLSTLKEVNGITLIDKVVDVTDETTEEELERLLSYIRKKGEA